MLYLLVVTFVICIALILIVRYIVKKIVMEKIQSEDECLKLLEKRKVFDIKKYNRNDYINVSIKSREDFNLNGFYYTNAYNSHSKKVLVFVHGYCSNHLIGLQFLSLFENMDFNILFIDMRRHGCSEGEYSSYGYFEKYDIALWVEYVKRKIGDNAIIGVMGQSMGAASVLQYASLNPSIDFIISDCAYSNAKDIIVNNFKKAKMPIFPFYNLSRYYIKIVCGFDIENIDITKMLKGIDIPTLFIHGSCDDLIPYTMSIDMYRVKNGRYDEICIFKEAKHVESYGTDSEKYTDAVEKFLRKIRIKL